MINLKNKRAAEMAVSTIIILALALLVLVVVGLGFWKGWDYVFGIVGLLPNDLNKAVMACQQYAGSDILITSFCQYNEFTINNVKGLWNCNGVHTEALKSQTQDAINFLPQTCIGEKEYCASVTDKKINVNGKACSEWEI